MTPKAPLSKLIYRFNIAAAAKSLQSCPTLCDPRDGSPPGSPVPGILQARTLEWVAISFSYAWKWKVKVKSLSRVRPSAAPWTAAYQARLSMGFSRQEHWSGVPLPSLDRFNIKPVKILAGFFAEIDHLILKFIWKFKTLRRTKQSWKRTKLEQNHTSWFQNLLQSCSNQDRVVPA